MRGTCVVQYPFSLHGVNILLGVGTGGPDTHARHAQLSTRAARDATQTLSETHSGAHESHARRTSRHGRQKKTHARYITRGSLTQHPRCEYERKSEYSRTWPTVRKQVCQILPTRCDHAKPIRPARISFGECFVRGSVWRRVAASSSLSPRRCKRRNDARDAIDGR